MVCMYQSTSALIHSCIIALDVLHGHIKESAYKRKMYTLKSIVNLKSHFRCCFQTQTKKNTFGHDCIEKTKKRVPFVGEKKLNSPMF